MNAVVNAFFLFMNNKNDKQVPGEFSSTAKNPCGGFFDVEEEVLCYALNWGMFQVYWINFIE